MKYADAWEELKGELVGFVKYAGRFGLDTEHYEFILSEMDRLEEEYE